MDTAGLTLIRNGEEYVPRHSCESGRPSSVDRVGVRMLPGQTTRGLQPPPRRGWRRRSGPRCAGSAPSPVTSTTLVLWLLIVDPLTAIVEPLTAAAANPLRRRTPDRDRRGRHRLAAPPGRLPRPRRRCDRGGEGVGDLVDHLPARRLCPGRCGEALGDRPEGRHGVGRRPAPVRPVLPRRQ